MPRKPSKRVVLNIAALDKLQFAVAVGLERFAQEVLEGATPIPDDPETKSSIEKTGGYVVLNGSRKVGGTGTKPRSLDTRRKGIITVAMGYGSPLAHIFERGTVGRVQKSTGRFTGAITPQPFLLPSIQRAVSDIAPIIAQAVADEGFGKP